MLLSLLGAPTTRREALELFGIARSAQRYSGTELTELARILRSSSRMADVRWLFLKTFVFAKVASRLRRQLNATRFPTLLWFGAVWRHRSVRAFHVALVVGLRRDGILLLDPLGRAPVQRRYNAWIRRHVNDSRLFEVQGAFYEVDPAMAVGILRWRRPRPTGRRR